MVYVGKTRLFEMVVVLFLLTSQDIPRSLAIEGDAPEARMVGTGMIDGDEEVCSYLVAHTGTRSIMQIGG